MRKIVKIFTPPTLIAYTGSSGPSPLFTLRVPT